MKKIQLSILISFLIAVVPNTAWTKSIKNNQSSSKSIKIETKNKLKLEDIILYTFENNNELKAEREKLKAVKTTKFRTFGENALPSLDLNINRGRKELKTTTSNQEAQINNDTELDELVLSQPLFKSGRTVTSLKAVNNKINIQKNALFSKEQNILFEAVNSSVNILKTRVVYDITKRNEEALKKGYEYSRARRRVGKSTVTEVLTAKSRYKDALSDTATAKTEMFIAQANFKRVVDLNSDLINTKQIEELFKKTSNYRISQDEVIEKSLTRNPDYLAIKENYSLNRNNLNFNKTDFLPTLSLNAGTSRGKSYAISNKAMTRSEESFVNLALKVPLIQSGVKYSDYKAGGYSLNQSKFEMKNATKVLREQSIKIHEEFLLSRELVGTAKAFMEATETALKASKEESKVGKITIIDLLDREREYFTSQIKVIEAKSNNILKYYSLKVLMGEMALTNLTASNDK